MYYRGASASDNYSLLADQDRKNYARRHSTAIVRNRMGHFPYDTTTHSPVDESVTASSSSSSSSSSWQFQMRATPSEDILDRIKVIPSQPANGQHQHQERGQGQGQGQGLSTGLGVAVRSAWIPNKQPRQEDYESDEMRDSDDEDYKQGVSVTDGRPTSSLNSSNWHQHGE